jgi:predicted metal-dependent phosphotriesterase family hydrolase
VTGSPAVNAPGARVKTVLGPIDPSELGVTLPHEHTQIALWHIRDRWDYWELTRDAGLIADELGRFAAAGGRSLVDLTLPGVGRDPAWLVEVARATGLNVVMGAGWYREAYYPPEALIDRRSVEDLADELIREATDGVDGVRPGIIGEIGTDKPWVSAQEERVFRAAARAARATGLAVTTHAVMSDVGRAQLRILEEEGIDPARVVIGHADSYPVLAHHLAIVETGASVEMDFLGMSFTATEQHGEDRTVALICELLARGHAERVLLSQDVCHNSQLVRYGGNGYAYLANVFLPRLRAAGVSDAEIEQLTVANPRRILTIG